MPIYLLLAFIFCMGACIGSYLNVCIYRLPLEKSVYWPGSHCSRCLHSIPWYCNIPLLSYWLLGGKCKYCRSPFSIRYFLIELCLGLCFAGLFYLEVVHNVLGLKIFADPDRFVFQSYNQLRLFDFRDIPGAGYGLLVFHAVFFCLLVITTFCDLDHLEIPLSVTMTGTLLGIVGTTLLWPYLPASLSFTPRSFHTLSVLKAVPGVHPWPFWHELPAWLPTASPVTGLLNSLFGVLAGILLLRGVRFIFGVGRGIEGMGIGDADFMMMVGSFLGWQPVVLAFFASLLPGLILGVVQILRRGNQHIPYGPSLALGSLMVWLSWPHLQKYVADYFFLGPMLFVLVGIAVVLLFVLSFLLRLIRG